MARRDDEEALEQERRDREVDATLQPGGKSKWVTSADSAADAPLTDQEKIGASVLGAHSPRDGAIAGVSDPVRDGRAAPHQRAGESQSAGPGGRRNPPEVPDAGMGPGGLSQSGGVAGGTEGGAGTGEE